MKPWNTRLSSWDPRPLRVEGSMDRFLLPTSRPQPRMQNRTPQSPQPEPATTHVGTAPLGCPGGPAVPDRKRRCHNSQRDASGPELHDPQTADDCEGSACGFERSENRDGGISPEEHALSAAICVCHGAEEIKIPTLSQKREKGGAPLIVAVWQPLKNGRESIAPIQGENY
jgi:hypothetical protein